MSLGEILLPHLRRRRVYIQALAVAVAALRNLLPVVRFRKVEMDLSLGAGDPSTTGLATGAVAAVSGLARAKCAAVSFRMRPVFGKRKIAVDGRVELSLAPADLLRALARTGIAALRKRELRRFAAGFLWDKVRSLLAG